MAITSERKAYKKLDFMIAVYLICTMENKAIVVLMLVCLIGAALVDQTEGKILFVCFVDWLVDYG